MFNAAAYFVDRHIEEGREGSTAIECADRRLSYRDLFDQVNRVGNALKMALDVRPEERVLLVMCDGPEMIAAFFGAIEDRRDSCAAEHAVDRGRLRVRAPRLVGTGDYRERRTAGCACPCH